MTIPTLNYSHFTSGTKEQREEFARLLVDSFERTGLVKLRGHIFSVQKLTESFTWVGPTSTYLVLTATLALFGRANSFLTSHWR